MSDGKALGQKATPRNRPSISRTQGRKWKSLRRRTLISGRAAAHQRRRRSGAGKGQQQIVEHPLNTPKGDRPGTQPKRTSAGADTQPQTKTPGHHATTQQRTTSALTTHPLRAVRAHLFIPISVVAHVITNAERPVAGGEGEGNLVGPGGENDVHLPKISTPLQVR